MMLLLPFMPTVYTLLPGGATALLFATIQAGSRSPEFNCDPSSELIFKPV